MFLPKYPGTKRDCLHVLRDTAQRDPESNPPLGHSGQIQTEMLSQIKSNAIKKEKFNEDPAEKFHLARVKREGRWKEAKSAS